MIIYLVTNLVNNKQYVGYTTKTLQKRKELHLRKAYSKNQKHYFYLFKQALRKYGEKSFRWEIIYTCTSLNECYEKEKYYIKQLNTISPNGYNLTEGGTGGIQSKETKDKISNSVKEYWKNNENKHPWKKISSKERSEWAKKSWKNKKNNGYIIPAGYKLSEESREKMSMSKNEKNKIEWVNIYSNEIVLLSCTKMSEYTGLSISTFNHIKKGRQIITKCGWTINKKGTF